MKEFIVDLNIKAIVEAENEDEAKSIAVNQDNSCAKTVVNSVKERPLPQSIYLDVVVAVPMVKLVKVSVERDNPRYKAEAIEMVKEGMGEDISLKQNGFGFYVESVTDSTI